MANDFKKLNDFLETLFPQYFLENISQDGDVLFRLIASELDKIIEAVAKYTDIFDPDKAPSQLLDYLASLFGVPFLPEASEVEKIAYIKSELATCSMAQVYEIASVYGVDLSLYNTPDEKRLACIVATDIANPYQIDQALYILGASYKLGIMTTEQKRLAIKQALSWYRVKGRERAYQILLHVYGLQAEITPLWTNNYGDFWDSPQGTLIEDGGTWYITPHYALDLMRFTDQGAISARILHQFVELVRNEVQPAHCVLERLSFSQYLVDYVEISEELVTEVSVPAVDVVGWPECVWQNRGREQVPVPLRNGMVGMNRTAVPMADIDFIMIGYGRGVDQWNGMFLPNKFRNGYFIQNWVYVDFFFNRESPLAPSSIFHYPELSRENGYYYRDGAHLYVPEEVADHLHSTYDEFFWLRGGVMFDHDWDVIDLAYFDPGYMFPRDPYYCERSTDPLEGEVIPEFQDGQHVAYPRNLCTPMKRDGTIYMIRDGSMGPSIDECLIISPEFEPDQADFDEDQVVDLEAVTSEDYICPDINYRDGNADMERVDIPMFRDPDVILRDGSLAYDRDGGNPYDRNYGGAARDGTYTRDFGYLADNIYRRNNYCYIDSGELIPELVDECIPVDVLEGTAFELESSDSHDIVVETSDTLEFQYGAHEHFCNTQFREYGVCCTPTVRLVGGCDIIRNGACDFDRSGSSDVCEGVPGTDMVPFYRNRTCPNPPYYVVEDLCRGSEQPPRDYSWEDYSPLRGCHADDFVRDGTYQRDYIDTLNPHRDGSLACLRDASILDCEAWRRNEGRCVEDDLDTNFEFMSETFVDVDAQLDMATSFNIEDAHDLVAETDDANEEVELGIRDHFCSLAYRDIGMCPMPHTTIINPCEVYRSGATRILRDGSDGRDRNCEDDTPRIIDERLYYRGSPRLPRDYYWPGVSIRSDAMHSRDGTFQRDFIDEVGPMRDGYETYSRDMWYLEVDEVTFRRNADGACLRDPVEVDVDHLGFEDHFSYSCVVYRDTDAFRDGTNLFFDRYGEGSCDRPTDTLEIVEVHCRTWDNGACRWDTGLTWDPA